MWRLRKRLNGIVKQRPNDRGKGRAEPKLPEAQLRIELVERRSEKKGSEGAGSGPRGKRIGAMRNGTSTTTTFKNWIK